MGRARHSVRAAVWNQFLERRARSDAPYLPPNPIAMFRRLAAVALVVCLGGMAEAQVITNWTRHFRIGGVVGFNMSADFKMNGTFNVSGGGQPGIFDDGYVLTDNTGNAGDYTSNWGYKNATQYDPGSHELIMHSSSSFSLTDSTEVDGDSHVGLDLVYGGKIMKSGDALFTWEFGFMWMPMIIKDTRSLSTTFNRASRVFDTGDIVMPEAPYNGGPSGIGPTIRDTGTPGPEEASPGTITGTRKLDMTLYNFRLGPAMHWEISRWFAFSVSGGAAMGLTTCTYKYNERINISDGGQTSNSGSFDNTETVFGTYANVTLLLHTKEKADVFVSAQYMMLDTVSVSSAGREASLDLGGGIYLSAGINWPF